MNNCRRIPLEPPVASFWGPETAMKRPSAKRAPAKQLAARMKPATAPVRKRPAAAKKQATVKEQVATNGGAAAVTRVTAVEINARAGTMYVVRQSVTTPDWNSLHYRPHQVKRTITMSSEMGAINHARSADNEDTRSERSEDYARSDVPTPTSSPSGGSAGSEGETPGGGGGPSPRPPRRPEPSSGSRALRRIVQV